MFTVNFVWLIQHLIKRIFCLFEEKTRIYRRW